MIELILALYFLIWGFIYVCFYSHTGQSNDNVKVNNKGKKRIKNDQ